MPPLRNPRMPEATQRKKRPATIYPTLPMQLAIARNNQTLVLTTIHPVRRTRPIKQAREARLPRKPRLHAHGAGHVVADEASRAAHAVRGDGLLVQERRRARPRQLAELERPALLVARRRRERLARAGRPGERPPVARHPQQDLGGRHLLRQAVRHGGGAGRRGGPRRCEQRGVVAGGRGPRAGVVVAHQVDQVEVAGGQRQQDVAQGPGAAGQRGGQREERRRQRLPDAGQQEGVVLALQRVGGVLPVDWGRGVRLAGGGSKKQRREGTHCLCRRAGTCRRGGAPSRRTCCAWSGRRPRPRSSRFPCRRRRPTGSPSGAGVCFSAPRRRGDSLSCRPRRFCRRPNRR